ncbi:MAG: DUF3098 domain-containing protein [Cyclobacteriaceae bacterium]|nr:DUF3098 domain-containing protein [Cyclobacteriaceae bacterium]MCX7637083.1 DUF3098 domain-containing protein [Cyclobacteriaceae bacterium]MDW8331544.1 DUF3098 domain-containing protein [Cyclobacteriaceae bacterium]
MENNLPFGRKNYQIMIAGLVVLVLGFIIMTLDNEPYGFGFTGLTLGPVIVILGFITELFAILYRPANRKK